MDLTNPAPFTQLRGRGAAGGLEWAPLCNQLLDNEARRFGARFTPVNDQSGGDWRGIADGLSDGHLAFPWQNIGREVFQHRCCKAPIPAKDRRDFEKKLNNLTFKPGHGVGGVVFFIPEDPTANDIEWLDTLRVQHPKLLFDIWGYTRYKQLLFGHRELLQRLYPELVRDDPDAREHLERLKRELLEPMAAQCRFAAASQGNAFGEFLGFRSEVQAVGGGITENPEWERSMQFHLFGADPQEVKERVLYPDLEEHFPDIVVQYEEAVSFQDRVSTACVALATHLRDEMRKNLRFPEMAAGRPAWVAYESITRIVIQALVWPERKPYGLELHPENPEVYAQGTMAPQLARCHNRSDCEAVLDCVRAFSEMESVQRDTAKLRRLLHESSGAFSRVERILEETLRLQYLPGRCKYLR